MVFVNFVGSSDHLPYAPVRKGLEQEPGPNPLGWKAVTRSDAASGPDLQAVVVI